MSKIKALQFDALSKGPPSPGIIRHLAFQGEGHLVVHAQAEPGTISGWHHHGDYDVYGYIVSGTARFESGSGEKDAISVGPGDFFHIPSHTIHRDVNPSPDEGQEVILFLRGTGPLVVNVDGPDSA